MSNEKTAVNGNGYDEKDEKLEHDFKEKGSQEHDEEANMHRWLDGLPTEERAVMEKKLLWKIDRRMSILVLIYMLNYMDRNNVAVARLRGFEADLKLQGNEYQTTLSILYVGYIGLQVPSNIYLNHFGRPSIYLPIIMILWGAVSCLVGVTNDFTGVVLCRFFIGAIEAGFFPGAIFLISRWYTKKEIALRTAILYCGNLSSNFINPLIAAGVLDNMEGDLGHAAWRWLFYIEGAATMAVAIIAFWILPDFPNNTRWLTPEERFMAQRRLVDDAGESDDDTHLTNWQAFVAAVRDPKCLILAFMQFCNNLGGSYNAFVPTIVKTLGYSRLKTLFLCIPPWVTSCIGVFLLARSADKRNERTYHICASFLFTMIGFIIAISTMHIAPRYLSLFFMTQSYGAYVVAFAWVSSTLPRPPAKRAVALSFVNASANIGNIIGPYIFKTSWGPEYTESWAISIVAYGLGTITALALNFYLKVLNKRLDAGVRAVELDHGAIEKAAELKGISVADQEAARKGWRYTL